MIRLLIADDHAVVRQGLLQILALNEDIRVVGEVADGWQVIDWLRTADCDLLLTDMSMPGPNGIALVKRVKEEHPGLPVLVLTIHGESQIAARVLKAGAGGYVTKDSEPAILLAAVRQVASGGHFVSSDLAQRLVFETGLAGDVPPCERLSDREYDIFLRIVQGKRLSEIAEALHVSPKTVSTHKMRLMQKLDVKSNTELMRYAIQHGLMS
ncbi:response regulator [Thiocystis violascens]|uniref:Response regulator containing a CheY-like receiver domain and an HTH DNA-binding domain n=1 Tax=Thiocystis violascens (strain ATCC 17096 / DSM 198 / 6111) TaxID=765911 RepID=I3YG10_THIV6|nr:response regulator transcription factor [Thiocystis violascens]AFL75928.1 response regulator containing a CheY-like receiver domain and an HTH DNA-binding domain [Thiocystis violascens DSM 198]